jgi:hypothetical protein
MERKTTGRWEEGIRGNVCGWEEGLWFDATHDESNAHASGWCVNVAWYEDWAVLKLLPLLMDTDAALRIQYASSSSLKTLRILWIPEVAPDLFVCLQSHE